MITTSRRRVRRDREEELPSLKSETDTGFMGGKRRRRPGLYGAIVSPRNTSFYPAMCVACALPPYFLGAYAIANTDTTFMLSLTQHRPDARRSRGLPKVGTQ